MRVDEKRPTQADPSPPDPFLGQVLGGCRIDEVIGRGGMGVVYKATQLSLCRPVAIKVLPEEVCGQPQFVERFRREVDVLSRLAHPNVVTVFERGETEGRLYVIMEYVQGTSLREVMRKGPLPAAESLVIVRGVLSALEHAHEKGIVHRDIKPENVLVAPGGIVKVADFGLSRLMGKTDATRLTHTNLLLGTYEYMAPEQRERAKEADERADIYATGVVLYEMLAGELPIGRFAALSRKRPKECDARIDEIVERSLAKSPEERYQHASEMGAAVSRLLSGVLVPVAAPPRTEPALAPPPPHWAGPHPDMIRGRRGRPGLWAAVGCSLAFLVGTLALASVFLLSGGAEHEVPRPDGATEETHDLGDARPGLPLDLGADFLDAERLAWIDTTVDAPFRINASTLRLGVDRGKVTATVVRSGGPGAYAHRLRSAIAYALEVAYPEMFVRDPLVAPLSNLPYGQPPGPPGEWTFDVATYDKDVADAEAERIAAAVLADAKTREYLLRNCNASPTFPKGVRLEASNGKVRACLLRRTYVAESKAQDVAGGLGHKICRKGGLRFRSTGVSDMVISDMEDD
jgi:predicted Ser/Thr protein kinase